ncbi:MAG: MarR family winged helix-turn-helix transcriptional regulator [Aeromonadaceae bacterium]
MSAQNNRAQLHKLDEALELFHFAFRAFTAGPDAILAEYGLQRVHHRILYFVGRHPAISVNALLRILGVSKQALNGPLRVLQEKGLIEANQDQQDRRIKRLSLSSRGQALEDELSNSQRHLMASVFANSGEQAETQWRTIMQQIAERQFAHLLAPRTTQPR